MIRAGLRGVKEWTSATSFGWSTSDTDAQGLKMSLLQAFDWHRIMNPLPANKDVIEALFVA